MYVGIYTPYGPYDVTLAALRVADDVARQGLFPKLLASGPIVKGVHPYWDQQIRANTGQAIYHWAQNCERLVWFEHQPRLLRRSKLVAEKAQQVFVPRMHHLAGQQVGDLAGYHRVVCPTKAAYEAILNTFAVDEDELTWGFWDSGLSVVCPSPFSLPEDIRFLVVLDRHTMRQAGHELLLVIDRLLSRWHCSFTVTASGSWRRRERRLCRYLKNKYKQRLVILPRLSLPQQLHAYHVHTWTVLPALRAEFGMLAMQSLACGTPVIAHDIFPFNEIMRDQQEGLLIPCREYQNALGISYTDFDIPTVRATLEQVLTDQRLTTSLRNQEWKLCRRRTLFEMTWSLDSTEVSS